MIQIPPTNGDYWISPRALTFSENDLNDPMRVAVSLVSGTVIKAYKKGIIDYAFDGEPERWTLKGYSTKLIYKEAHFVYARLSRTDRTALIVFSVKDYNIDGSITTVTGKDENGNDVTETTDPSADYFYIKVGELTATDGTSNRELTYDSGLLSTKKGDEESSLLNELWELIKGTNPLIRAKYWLTDFVVKGFVTFIGGFKFSKGKVGDEKIVADIKRSTDGDSEYLRNEDGSLKTDENGNPIKDTSYVPINDETIPTTKYVQSMNDDRYLSKIKPDETPYHIGLKGGLTTTEVTSTDYAKDIQKAGWASKRNEDEEWYLESDHLVARILGRVYDLLVENHAVFKESLSSEEFVSGFIGGKGWAIRMKEWENAAGITEKRSYAEFDDLVVRGSMRVYEFIVSQMLGENDNRIFTGMMEVDHYDASDGKIYLKTDNGKLYNPFRIDDIIIVQQYGGMPSEDNNYYVIKQYEFIVTGVGVGNTSEGEERLDWLTFRNFTTSMEGGDLSLITERDTLVRIDNLSDARRKGVIQMMSVGEDTPYMDFIYGAKTDPENALKGRFGNIRGIYNPLFGWLKEFGAYLTNLYAVGEFRIAHTGEDVADAIEIAKGQFRTNYKQTTFDMTEEDNFFTNASMTNNCEYWVLGEEATSYFLVEDIPQFFNYELYGSEDSFAGIAEHNGRDMLRLSRNGILQKNELIDKPGTHKVHTGTTENEDGTYTKEFEEVPDTLYLSVRIYCADEGTVELGFVDGNGTFYNNDFHVTKELSAQEDAYTIKVASTWDGIGDFCIKSSGDIYIDLLSFTDKPLENFMIETSTSIEQTAEAISMLGMKINGPEGTVSVLRSEINAAEERITQDVATVKGDVRNAHDAADAAQQAADDAAAAAFKAQGTADNTATNLTQTSEYLSLVAAAFEQDEEGNLVLDKNGKPTITKAAGAVITAESASLYATQTSFNALTGRVEKAEAKITTSVQYDPNTHAVTSNIILSADQINLDGAVTFSMLNRTLQGTINGKLEQSDLDGYATDSELANAQTILNNSISALNTTLTAKIDEKATIASLDSLNDKVTNLNTSLTTKVDKDLSNAVVNGSTLIVNGLINSDLIIAKNFRAVNEGYTYSLDANGFSITNSESKVLSHFYVSNAVITLDMSKGDLYSAMFPAGFSAANGSNKISLTGNHIELSGNAVIKNFRLGNISSTVLTTTDFIRTGSNMTLPAPSSCPGKVIFTRTTSDCTISSSAAKIYPRSGSLSSSFVRNNTAQFFISDGTYWHEFYCG